MKVHFKVAAAFRKTQFIETGVELPDAVSVEIDPAVLPRELREFIAQARIEGFLQTGLSNGGDRSAETMLFRIDKYTPQTGDIFAAPFVTNENPVELFTQFRDAVQGFRLREEQAAAEDKAARQEKFDTHLNQLREEQATPLDHFHALSRYNAISAAPYNTKINDLEGADEAREIVKTLNALYQEMKAADDKVKAAKTAEREAQEKVDRDQRAAEKLTWIEAHGSDFLKLAASEGFDCQRKYAIERGDLELPGFVVDIEDAALWNSRSCPSVAALKLLKEAKANGHNADLVWLTAQACEDSKDDMTRYDDWEQCEAVIVRGFLGKYDAVKEF